MKKKGLILFVLLSSLITGCGSNKNLSDASLKLVTFDSSSELNTLVAEYNEGHEVQIEVEEYERTDESGADGLLQLKNEVLAGNGPDIIDFGWDYSTSDIYGEYTEDLTAILSNSGENYFDNIVEAYKYKNKLYAVPIGVNIDTLLINTEYVVPSEITNCEDLIAAYRDFKGNNENRYFFYGETKAVVLSTFLEYSLNSYVNWETGECSFDSDEFKSFLEFSNEFPEEFVDRGESLGDIYKREDALSYPEVLFDLRYVSYINYLFSNKNGDALGYPTSTGFSNIIENAGPVLAINTFSEKKGLAEDFIEYCLDKEHQEEIAKNSFVPINKVSAKSLLNEYMTESDEEIIEVGFGGEESAHIYSLSEDECDTAIDIIENAKFLRGSDMDLYSIILEEAQGYLDGSKDVDSVCDVIQKRAQIYVMERMENK